MLSGGSGRRRILHIDMDAFYASVEQRDNRRCADGRWRSAAIRTNAALLPPPATKRALSASALPFPMSRAVRLCPQLVIVHPDFNKYRTVSQQVFAIFRSITPLVEPMSLDEAYLDVTENGWNEPLGMTVARRLKEEIRAATGLTASAGVAPNKFLAKIASGWKKPDGLTVIAPERVESFLHGLPVDALWGVGPVTAKKLRAAGIEKLIDVRTADAALLRDAVGSLGEWLQQLARGEDDRPVVAEHEPKSSGSENTFAHDLTDIDDMRDEIAAMARDAASWLLKRALYARTVTIKVRYHDFTTITRSHTEHETRDEESIVRARSRCSTRRTLAARRCDCLGSVCIICQRHRSCHLTILSRGCHSRHRPMLKGSRDAVLHKLQPISIHGQLLRRPLHVRGRAGWSGACGARRPEALAPACRTADASAWTSSSASSPPCTRPDSDGSVRL
jgi:DNA polymerase-4